jgi:hypothetical protein
MAALEASLAAVKGDEGGAAKAAAKSPSRKKKQPAAS